MALLTAADLNPFDSFKLMKLIYRTAKQAKVHRETCNEFANYIGVINNLLKPLQASPQLSENAAVQDALNMLQRTLVKAYLLIQKCEGSSTLSALLKHVPRHLKELEGEIQKILSLLNLANLHVHLNISTNGSSIVLSETLSSPALDGPSLGLSQSLEKPAADFVDHPQRSYSAPATSGQTSATAQSLSARSLSITWGQDERHWKWVKRASSRFSEVAYLVDVYWLEVQGELHTSTLRPGTYSVSWRLDMACLEEGTTPSGWDSEPIVFKFSTSDGRQHAERVYFVGGTSGEASTSDKSSLVQNVCVGESKHGWTDYVVGTFTVKKKQIPVLLTTSMTELNGGWKRGLFLDGVFITPCSGPDNGIVLEDERTCSMGLEDSPNLPGKISFRGHDHELQLMTDPFWFSCGVCEATEQVMGYRCCICGYSVHLQCCISDHQFATLLELTDSEFSHWHWEDLLELNKHRKQEKALRPKKVMFAQHPHHLQFFQNPHPTFVCDARNCDGQGWVFRGWDGWVYRCGECDFDVHPECRFGG